MLSFQVVVLLPPGGFWVMSFITARAREAFDSRMADSTVYMPGIVLSSVMFQHLNTDSDAVSSPVCHLLFFNKQCYLNVKCG